VTPASWYVAGTAVIVGAGAVLILLLPPSVRDEVAWGLLIAVAIQAPLGWWTLRSIGTPRFQLVWSLGMLLRLAILAVAGVIVVPALGWQTGPMLGTLVGSMVALLLVEAVSAMREHSWGKG
jgi:heme A synthase